MNISPYRPVPPWQRALRSSAVGLSIAFHVLLAMILIANPGAAATASKWVEMTVAAPPPPPPPPPPPEPEAPKPEPPKPKPKVVKFEETTPNPPPTPEVAPPPDPTPRRVVRQVQGLSANSFAPGAGSGLSVRAGNSTSVKATGDGMSLDEANEAFQSRPYTAVTVAPRVRSQPSLDVPEEARKAGVQGVISVLIDIDARGRVVNVKVIKGLGYGTDEACAAAWKRSIWKPGEQDGTPVGVLGIPEKCTVILTQ